MKAPIRLASGLFVLAISCSLPAAALPSRTGALASLEARADSFVHKAANRGCRWRNGVRHCRRAPEPRPRDDFYRQGYGYTYGAPRAEFYPAGSGDWWRAMEREGRTANPPN
jgi:hypothetical protein